MTMTMITTMIMTMTMTMHHSQTMEGWSSPLVGGGSQAAQYQDRQRGEGIVFLLLVFLT